MTSDLVTGASSVPLPIPLGSLGQEETGDLAYHYTDAAGLKGIIELRALWATSAWFMNDMREGTYGMRAIVKFAKSLQDRDGIPTEVGQSCLDYAKRLLTIHEEGGLESYIACFSRRDDQLSQWRAYCKNGGYSLGFDLAGLRRLGLRDVTIREVAYGRGQYDFLLNQILQRVLAVEGRTAQARGEDFILQAAMLAPTLKHRGFEEEAEVRLQLFLSSEERKARLKFRSTERGLTPYAEISLGEGEDPPALPLREIVVGPSPDQRGSEIAARQLLARHGYGESVTVRRSRIPLRV
jgi:hypothetical protein